MTNDKIQISNKSFNDKSNSNKTYDIKKRAFEFAVRTAKFIKKIPRNHLTIEYVKQLIRSSASIGANLEEADGALSRKDFINKVAIGRRESRESRYWLRLINMAEILNINEKPELDYLEGEAEEILLILSSIINKSQKKQINL